MFRLAKEKTVYEQEVVQQTGKIEKMKTDGKSDEYDIRKQVGLCNPSKLTSFFVIWYVGLQVYTSFVSEHYKILISLFIPVGGHQ